ncbi:aldehyde dehydrogenase family protein [Anaerobacillus sp. MEB173]|uniref:aldehyde dehydrogenase family protein n=1 Tax=Anaerobacillus sp. MEB173 TaxID=3383345 RepID=UPI003F8E6756
MESMNWIGGEWIKSQAKSKVVYNPSNLKEEVGIVNFSDRSHVYAAEKAARQGYKVWSKMTAPARGNILNDMADKLAKNTENLATLASREMGKPIMEMKGEVTRAVNLLRYYAAEGVRSDGDIVPASDVNVLQYSKRVPLGVVGIITPWNFPVAIPIWKIAPALICGNTVIWKPADIASLTATKMMEIFQSVDLPDGVLNLVVGKGSEIGNTLLEEITLNGVSFTGSTTIGQQVASICARRNIKYQTEMGGKNAAIVLKDAELDKIIPMIVSGAFRSAGQKCTATSRIIVEKDIYSEFIKGMKDVIKHDVTLSNALDPESYLGPVASKEQFDTVNSYINLARKESQILVEGTRKNDGIEGYYVNPIVTTGVSPQHPLVQEEVFGPVAVVLEAKDFDESIQLANETIYGLSASVFTSNLSKAHRFLDEVEAGMVRVNQETAGVEYQAPFGGMKFSSSHTREQGQSALDFYSQLKTCAIKHTL